MSNINFCVHELKSGVPDLLLQQHKVTIIQRIGRNQGASRNYDLVADYIVETDSGKLFGIERKSLFDMYQTRVTIEEDGQSRLVKQFRKLRDKYNENAIILLEDSDLHIDRIRHSLAPSIMNKKESEIEDIIVRGAYSLISKASFMGYKVLVSRSKRHSADLLLKIAKKWGDEL